MSSLAWTERAPTSSKLRNPSTRWTWTTAPETLNFSLRCINRQVTIQSRWRGARTASVSTTSEPKSLLHFAPLIRKTWRSRSSNQSSLAIRRRKRRSRRLSKASKHMKRKRVYVWPRSKTSINRYCNIVPSPSQPGYSMQNHKESTRWKNKTRPI